MHYRSTGQLNADIVRWADALPKDIDLVVGIPRSGMLAATMLALHLHTPLADLDGLLAGRVLTAGQRMRDGRSAVIDSARRILVLDDSINKGGSMREAQHKLAAGAPELSGRVVWGATYVAPGNAKALVDYWYESIPQPRAFEWNILHHADLADACMDIDGVLCPDPDEEQNDDGPRYEEFLSQTPTRLVPGTEVGWLVTARLERYREQTEEWLRVNGIRYGELLMHPAATAEQRRQEQSHASFKAEVYRRTKAWLFIESSIEQAVAIADIVRRPVYCTDRQVMVHPGVPVGGVAPRRHAAHWRIRNAARHQRRRVKVVRRRLTQGVDTVIGFVR
ncbi:MAG: hypothetical protein WA962_06140 [Ornithinimicrobium sp.]